MNEKRVSPVGRKDSLVLMGEECPVGAVEAGGGGDGASGPTADSLPSGRQGLLYLCRALAGIQGKPEDLSPGYPSHFGGGETVEGGPAGRPLLPERGGVGGVGRGVGGFGGQPHGLGAHGLGAKGRIVTRPFDRGAFAMGLGRYHSMLSCFTRPLQKGIKYIKPGDGRQRMLPVPEPPAPESESTEGPLQKRAGVTEKEQAGATAKPEQARSRNKDLSGFGGRPTDKSTREKKNVKTPEKKIVVGAGKKKPAAKKGGYPDPITQRGTVSHHKPLQAGVSQRESE